MIKHYFYEIEIDPSFFNEESAKVLSHGSKLDYIMCYVGNKGIKTKCVYNQNQSEYIINVPEEFKEVIPHQYLAFKKVDK